LEKYQKIKLNCNSPPLEKEEKLNTERVTLSDFLQSKKFYRRAPRPGPSGKCPNWGGFRLVLRKLQNHPGFATPPLKKEGNLLVFAFT